MSLDAFERAFLECALWSSTDETSEAGGEPLDSHYSIADFEEHALRSLLRDCRDFREANAELLAQAGDDSQNGHDFWLTRNGHGAGFWDRGYGAIGEALSKASKVYGSVDLFVNPNDGKVYL